MVIILVLDRQVQKENRKSQAQFTRPSKFRAEIDNLKWYHWSEQTSIDEHEGSSSKNSQRKEIK